MGQDGAQQPQRRNRPRSIAERFARRLSTELTRLIGPDGWSLEIMSEADWASATLEGVRIKLQLDLADSHGAPALAKRIEALDFPLPRHFIGDMVARPAGEGISVTALLLDKS